VGVALARHGDLAGAEVKLKDANQRGPLREADARERQKRGQQRTNED
jgi:hypothetical protein